MDWLQGIKKYNAVDVTDRYLTQTKIDSGLVAVSIRVLNNSGERKSVDIIVTGENNYFFEGQSKNETYDMNDHLTIFLPKGEVFTIKSKNDSRILEVENECLVSLSVK